MASTREGQGWQVQAGLVGRGPRLGWQRDHSLEGEMKGHGQGRTKGPAPHLAAKGAGHHLHDKGKPLSIWAVPKGDLPSAFEVGSRAPRAGGWGHPDASPWP